MSSFGELTALRVEQTGPSGGEEFVYVDISSIDNQAKRIVDPKRLSPEAAPSRARQRLRKGDVLVSMTRPNLNAVAIVPPDLDGAIGSTGFHVLRANDDVEPHWLYYAVQSSSFVKSMCDLVQGALYPAVRPKDIREYAISPPPLAKQREIVAELEKQFSRLDEAVANLQRVKANLKRYRASVLNDAVEGRLVECDSPVELVKLGSVANLIDPQPSHRTPPTHPDGVPYIGIGDVLENGKLDFQNSRKVSPTVLEEHRARYTLSVGDFIFGKIGTLGRPTLLTPPFAYTLSANVVLVQADGVRLLPEYALIFMDSPKLLNMISRDAKATTQAAYGIKRMRDLEINIPDIEQQRKIVAEVDRHLSIIREVETEVDANLQRAQALRQSTLAKAFSP